MDEGETTPENHREKEAGSSNTPGDARDLLRYLSHLHQTELSLRSLVLEQLGKVPLAVIATAADERVGTLENMDAADFENETDPSSSVIDWKTTGSDWISQTVYRPNSESMLGNESTPCYWYQIQEWSESIASEAEDAEEDAVERRKRFRAVPVEEKGGGRTGALILTEAQVHAGRQAAKLQAEREKKKNNRGGDASWTTTMISNPFATEVGDRITLVALDDDGDEDEDNDSNGGGNRKAPTEISGRVVGHDSVLEADDDDSSSVEHRILILSEQRGSNSNSEKDSRAAAPFWAVLDVREDDASYLCQPEGQSRWYSIENQDFHADSEPYKACQGILEWLSRQSKAMPFMEPVDPVALGIPTYPDVIKNPMDISTMTEKLENGAYSNIPPSQLVGTSLVCRMLNGPFRKDAELIFDNAMLFNPPDDWISVAAAALKKSVTKKIDAAAYSAEKKNANSGNHRKSIYADEDSDVDMYEYESDNDEDFGSSSRRGKRKRSNGSRAASNKDEAAARPMEHPIRLQNCLKDGNDLRGRFSGLPINGYASTYSMPFGWSCRTATPGASGAIEGEPESAERGNEDDEDNNQDEDHTNQEHLQEMADLLALQKRLGETESSNLRRSSRETRPTAGRRSASKKKDATKKTEGLEYHLLSAAATTKSSSSSSGEEKAPPAQQRALSSIPSTRLDVEILLEKRHEEHYAKLYRKHEKDLVAASSSGSSGKDDDDDDENNNNNQPSFAIYSSGSFPPYLGRVLPSRNQQGASWEIRPPFAVPALRWVLRGLVVSGHLTATEPLFAGGAGASNHDTTAGVVLCNDVYYKDPGSVPFEVLDTRVLQRRRRAGKSDGDDSSEDEVEMSEYEKMRAERVARNAERLKALGLA